MVSLMLLAHAALVAVQLLVGVRGQEMLVDSNATVTLGEDHTEDCPPWAHFNANHTACQCRKQQQPTVAKCEEGSIELQLLACYCLSYYTELNMTVYGKCLFTCSQNYYYIIHNHDRMENCNELKRQGELCSSCKNGTGHPLYSYKLNCVACSSSAVTLLQYVVIAYLPLTAFFLLVIAFRISANAEMLSGYILMSQIITTPTQLRYISSLRPQKSGSLAISTFMAVNAIWNLDFFRGLYKPFCYSEFTSTLFVVSLDYLIALYPLGLIFITYGIVKIHDRFLIVAKIWTPVHRVFMRIRREWNVKKSLVDAFTTFFLLSYIKILNASFDLLMPTVLHNMTGHTLPDQYYLYYDGKTRGFHGKHTVYGILAISMLLVFNIIPLLILLLYPCKLFQMLLNRMICSARLQPLHIFMDSLLGCYRIAPRDCRYFAAFSLLVRIGNLVIFAITLSRYCYPFGCALFIGMAALVMVVKPYKSPVQNTVDATLYLVFAFGYLGATGYALTQDNSYNAAFITFMGSSSLVSLLYLLGVILRNTVLKSLLPRIRRTYFSENEGNVHVHDQDEELYQSTGERSESTPLLDTLRDVKK